MLKQPPSPRIRFWIIEMAVLMVNLIEIDLILDGCFVLFFLSYKHLTFFVMRNCQNKREVK